MAADLSSAVDSTLASQCMAFCQALASQGKSFSFTLKIDSNFCFSLDTRESNVKATLVKKRTSPSTQRRNARRREEFLKKKLNFSSLSSSALDAPADISPATNVAAAKEAFSHVVASTPATLPSPPSKQVAKDNNTLSEELEEDIPETVLKSECASLSVFRGKSFSTPPKKAKHSFHGIGLFKRITHHGFYSYESDDGVRWVVDPSVSPN